ncbi:hypothetical protein [Chryseobacterium lathyri]|uniref:hypothetical protein n=1 Tax=Chryseobacterium lathyri TaxID=395933 RepID=UPI00278151CB|nr:hypothetical protein [Chryseobacterium lathyri]MDQ0065134.1 hypothetical protein [Chryseobacterium lathyri]
MGKYKLLFIISFFLSSLIYAQNTNEYKFLFEGQHNSKIYSKFESKEGNKIKLWYKIEETKENNPGVAFTEYYLQVNCEEKTYMLNTSTTYWRDGTIQKIDPPGGIPKIVAITESGSIAGITYQNYCRK